MQEIEAKILDVDVAEIAKKLQSLGAVQVFDGEIVSTSYDFADKSLSKQEKLIRLRKRGETIELTYKHLVDTTNAKVSEEIEVNVTDIAKMHAILSALGLRPRSGQPIEKHRITYELGSTHFEIDTIPGIPTFLEIEAPTWEDVLHAVEQLGFSRDDIKPWGTREVFAYYRSLLKSFNK